jgi:hypothetical protein
MSLVNRQAEFSTALTDLMTLVKNADVDLAAADPDSAAIMHLREMASGALGAMGFNSGEPQ